MSIKTPMWNTLLLRILRHLESWCWQGADVSSGTLSTMAAVLPYQFEPESDPESDNGAEDANDERDFSRRMDQDISQW